MNSLIKENNTKTIQTSGEFKINYMNLADLEQEKEVIRSFIFFYLTFI